MMGAPSRHALVGDIGGTHARFAFWNPDKAAIEHFAVLQTARFASLQDALRLYFQSVSIRPARVGLAVAGPIVDDTVTMTNAPWTFTAADIREATGATEVHLLNDFEALAISLPSLSGQDLKRVHSGEAEPEAPKIVLGPGTGLGVGGLIRTATGWRALSGEGGHMTFGATNAPENAFLAHLATGLEHVSIERLLSGSGLQAMYAVLNGTPGAGKSNLQPAEIASRAEDGSDRAAAEALRHFVALLARVAGDAALLIGARGGVYLGGGIPPKILSALDTNSFRKAFENKGRMSDYLSRIPIDVVMAGDAGLRGAAIALSEHYPAV